MIPDDAPLIRAVIRMCAEHVEAAPGRDYDRGRTAHQAVADIVRDLLDDLRTDPRVLDRIEALLAEEATA